MNKKTPQTALLVEHKKAFALGAKVIIGVVGGLFALGIFAILTAK